MLNEAEIYKELGILTDKKDEWEESIPYVLSLLTHDSVKIKAKALWLIGEMGLIYPMALKEDMDMITSFFDSTDAVLRERAVIGSGRI